MIDRMKQSKVVFPRKPDRFIGGIYLVDLLAFISAINYINGKLLGITKLLYNNKKIDLLNNFFLVAMIIK